MHLKVVLYSFIISFWHYNERLDIMQYLGIYAGQAKQNVS